MERPYIVCHMLTSLNGKISGPFMNTAGAEVASNVYETTNNRYHSQAWLCGRVTMEENFTNYHKPVLKPVDYPVSKEDFIAEKQAAMYIVSVDPSGKVGWDKNYVDYAKRPRAHIIEVLTERVTDAYLVFLREKRISYIFAGKETIDCRLAAEKLFKLFQIETLMVSGGGVVNWSFLQEGIVDEVSVVVAPVTDGEKETHTIFEGGTNLAAITPVDFKLKAVEVLRNEVLWLRYHPKTF
ncbi:dihydrofolate reductase family protein [Candidatus Enterococcus ferrettii]|uniref:Bacterial bifunctional deaminase-reductase C-terminal domain-containing protein n=1 Tax=Candidatus Enterococcus ferrettii TaxID=2815324 RepID=A0ABV0EWG7_9ENTE|nr:RibD family protein [Enterococcus sp. 665A]MBO1342171.1 RibD family protein [Enterococcus sp. 665A]